MARSGIIPSFKELVTAQGTGSSGILSVTVPQTHKDLEISLNGRSSHSATSDTLRLTFESSPTSGAYNRQHMYVNGAAASFTAQENLGVADFIQMFIIPAANSPANCYGQLTADIIDYKNTSKYKTVQGNMVVPTDLTTGTFYLPIIAGLAELTPAITVIRFTLANGNWTTDSILRVSGKR